MCELQINYPENFHEIVTNEKRIKDTLHGEWYLSNTASKSNNHKNEVAYGRLKL